MSIEARTETTSLNGLTIQSLLVTPPMAKEWLDRPRHLPKINARRVHHYAEQMRQGAWQQTGDCIRFGTDGSLIDGQHRLSAVVLADVSVPLFVMEGLDPEIRRQIDTGRSRGLADFLTMEGYQSAKILGGAINILHLLLSHDSETPGHALLELTPRLARTEVQAYLATYSELPASISQTLVAPLRNYAPSTMAALVCLYLRYDTPQTAAFLEGLVTGEGLRRTDARLSFRDRLLSREFASRTEFAALFLKTWWAFLEHRNVRFLRWIREGPTPEAFPQIPRPGMQGRPARRQRPGKKR